MKSHLALLGFIICLRHQGDRPVLPQASTIRLAAVCPSLPVLLRLLRLSVGGRYSCLNVQQHKGGVGLQSHRLHFPSSYLSLAASLILIKLMDIRSSSVRVCFFCAVLLPSWGWFIWTILPSLWESGHHHNRVVSALTCTQACEHEHTQKWGRGAM